MVSPNIWDLVKHLNEISIALTRENSWDLLLERVLTEARSFTNCDAGTIYTLENEVLSFRVAQCDTMAKRQSSFRPSFNEMSLPLNTNSIAGYTALSGEVVNLPDVYNLSKDVPFKFNSSLVDEPFDYRTISILALPLNGTDQEILGVLQLINALDAEGNVVSFSPLLEELCSLLASQAAVALNNARLYRTLQEAHDFYQELVGEAGDAIVTLDREGIIITWNTGAEKMFGWKSQEVIGRSFLDLQSTEVEDEIKELLRRVHDGELLSNVEIRRQKKDGTWLDALTTISPVRSPQGEVIAILGIVKDITNRRQAEEELKEAHEGLKNAYERLEQTQQRLVHSEKLASLGFLAAGVSHEILNPLNIITMNLQLIVEDPATPAEIASQLDTLQVQAERIGKITQNMLYFSRQREPERRRLDLNDVAKRTLNLLEQDLRLRNIEVESRLAEELPAILADQDQVQQVILNLLTNARDAMPKGGRLILSTEKGESDWTQFVELRVEDTGDGIAPEHMGKLFDPFFSTKEEGEGTGLGLSTCHGIIEAHGGSIRAENISGGGAALLVQLPIMDEGKMGRKVLVVDDEPLFCEMLRKFLEGRGYIVEEAYDGDQALALYRETMPDVVLLDVKMPGKGGLETLRELKLIDQAASVIMLTAVQDQELVRLARDEGAVEYITKPVNLEHIDTALTTAMGLIGSDA